MIRFECDKCGREIEAQDAASGSRMDCPYCGDVNRVPAPSPDAPVVASDDRAAAAGLPPDSGPEAPVLLIRPAFWRGAPFITFGIALLPILLGAGLMAFTGVKTGTVFKAAGIAAAICWLPLAVWWLIVTRGASLEITNKRTIQRRGLLSRSTSEVLHDHVRNIQIEQSFLGRILNVGDIGISSSGQEGIEVQVRHIPRPRKVRSVIDTYRPM